MMIWSLVNLCFLIAFIFVCLKATAMIRSKLGRVAACVFVFGLLSSMTLKKQNNSHQEWILDPSKSHLITNVKSMDVSLEDFYFTKYHLNVSLSEDKITKSYVPSIASTHVSGLVGGTQWVPKMVHIAPFNGHFKYKVLGVIEWKLLGAPLYLQAKTYDGEIFP